MFPPVVPLLVITILAVLGLALERFDVAAGTNTSVAGLNFPDDVVVNFGNGAACAGHSDTHAVMLFTDCTFHARLTVTGTLAPFSRFGVASSRVDGGVTVEALTVCPDAAVTWTDSTIQRHHNGTTLPAAPNAASAMWIDGVALHHGSRFTVDGCAVTLNTPNASLVTDAKAAAYLPAALAIGHVRFHADDGGHQRVAQLRLVASAFRVAQTTPSVETVAPPLRDAGYAAARVVGPLTADPDANFRFEWVSCRLLASPWRSCAVYATAIEASAHDIIRWVNTTLDGVVLNQVPLDRRFVPSPASNMTAWNISAVGGALTGGVGPVRAAAAEGSHDGSWCPDDMTATAALAVCRALGYDATTARGFAVGTLWGAWTVHSPVYRAQLLCLGPDAACAFDSVAGCSTTATPAVDCSDVPWQLRTAPGDTRVEIGSGGDVWQPVCADGITAGAADKICEAVGLYGRRGHVGTAPLADAATAAVELAGCPSNATSAAACSWTVATPPWIAACSSQAQLLLTCLPPAQPSTGFTFRLGLDGADAGVLQFRSSAGAAWNDVCADGFSDRAAGVTCATLGYAAVGAAWYPLGDDGAPSAGDHVMRDVSCDSGAASLYACTYFSHPACSATGRAVFVDCSRTLARYRLVGTADPTSGRLEVRSNASEQWATVCGVGFTADDAAVACRSVGLPLADTAFAVVQYAWMTDAGVGGAHQAIWQHRMECTGSERALSECPTQPTEAACSHADDVFVSCWPSVSAGATQACRGGWCVRLRTTVAGAAAGAVEVKRRQWGTGVAAPWASVCLTLDAMLADGLCGLLGYAPVGRVSPYPLPTRGASDAELSFRSVSHCVNGSLDTCDIEPVATCDAVLALWCPPLPSAERFTFRLLPSDAIGALPSLQVRTNGSAVWRPVACAEAFTAASALVACRSLGHASATWASWSTESGEAQVTSVPLDIACDGGESSLAECLVAAAAGTSVCAAGAALLSCGVAPPSAAVGITAGPAPPTLWARLADASRPGAGRLELSPSAEGPWGTVCGRSFNATAAAAACATFGFAAAGAAFVLRGAVSSTQTIAAGGVRCPTAAQRLSDCVLLTDDTNGCTHADDVYLLCVAEGRFRLAGGTTSEGRLEYRSTAAAAWGTWCSNSVQLPADADAACRVLGFSAAASYWVNASAADVAPSPPEQPVWAGRIACVAESLVLAACSFGLTASCPVGFHLAVRCGAAPDDASRSITAAALGAWSVELRAGSNARGAVTVRQPSGVMALVCRSGFTGSDAAAMCRFIGGDAAALGFTAVVLEMTWTTAPLWPALGLTCSADSESVSDCGVVHSPRAATCGGAVAIDCAAGAWEFRLVGGSARVGRLETRPDSVASWRPACSTAPSDLLAAIACRSLGFHDAQARLMPQLYGAAPAGDVHMRHLLCMSNDTTSLVACSFGPGFCALPSQVSISCAATVPIPSRWDAARLTTVPTLLNVRPSTAADVEAWGAVCADGFDTAAADAACSSISGRRVRSLGWRRIGQLPFTMPVWMGELNCTNATALDDCVLVYRPQACLTGYVLVGCEGDDQRSLAVAELPTGYQLRFRPSIFSVFSPVCVDAIDHVTAAVLCRSVQPTQYGLGRVVAEARSRAPFTGLAVSCAPNATNITTACTLVASPNATNSLDCPVARIECLPFSALEPSAGAVYTVPDPAAFSTPVLVSIPPPPGNTTLSRRGESAVAQRAQLCLDAVSPDVAALLCAMSAARTLGSHVSPAPIRSDLPVVSLRFFCPHSAATLSQCVARAAPAGAQCSTVAALTCNLDWRFRLRGGHTAQAGRIEVQPRPNASWGVVTAGDSGPEFAQLALIACRSVRSATQRAALAHISVSDVGWPVLWMDNAACPLGPGTRTLVDCAFDLRSNLTLIRRAALAVVCYAGDTGNGTDVVPSAGPDGTRNFNTLVMGLFIICFLVVLCGVLGALIYARRRRAQRLAEEAQAADEDDDEEDDDDVQEMTAVAATLPPAQPVAGTVVQRGVSEVAAEGPRKPGELAAAISGPRDERLMLPAVSWRSVAAHTRWFSQGLRSYTPSTPHRAAFDGVDIVECTAVRFCAMLIAVPSSTDVDALALSFVPLGHSSDKGTAVAKVAAVCSKEGVGPAEWYRYNVAPPPAEFTTALCLVLHPPAGVPMLQALRGCETEEQRRGMAARVLRAAARAWVAATDAGVGLALGCGSVYVSATGATTCIDMGPRAGSPTTLRAALLPLAEACVEWSPVAQRLRECDETDDALFDFLDTIDGGVEVAARDASTAALAATHLTCGVCSSPVACLTTATTRVQAVHCDAVVPHLVCAACASGRAGRQRAGRDRSVVCPLGGACTLADKDLRAVAGFAAAVALDVVAAVDDAVPHVDAADPASYSPRDEGFDVEPAHVTVELSE